MLFYKICALISGGSVQPSFPREETPILADKPDAVRVQSCSDEYLFQSHLKFEFATCKKHTLEFTNKN